MENHAESSGGGRSRSRREAGANSRVVSAALDPVGELSGFPLIPCPLCHLARVVEGRTKKESENHGRLYFKCARNAYPKLCSYYRFEKAYFQHLQKLGVVIVRPSNWVELEVEEEVSVESPVESPVDLKMKALEHRVGDKKMKALEHRVGDKKMKALEHRVAKLTWLLQMVIACVFGCAVMYALLK